MGRSCNLHEISGREERVHVNFVVCGSEAFLVTYVSDQSVLPERISSHDLSGYYVWIRDTETGLALAVPNALRFDHRVIIWSIDSYGPAVHKSMLEIFDEAIKWERTVILHMPHLEPIPATIRGRARIIVEPQARGKPKFLPFEEWAAQLLHQKR